MPIRPVTSHDLPALKKVIDGSGLFPSALLDEMIAPFLSGQGHDIWLTYSASETGPIAVAYCAPEPMTEGCWNLYLIAVLPAWQSKGIGRQIMTHVEAKLRAQEQRILLVETSGLPEYRRTRDFYLQCDYTQEARIRDFYAAGEDKVVFWKQL